MAQKGAIGPCKASWALENLTVMCTTLLEALIPHGEKKFVSQWSIWSAGVKIVELTGRLFIWGGDCWDLGRTNSPTSVRHGDGLGYV